MTTCWRTAVTSINVFKSCYLRTLQRITKVDYFALWHNKLAWKRQAAMTKTKALSLLFCTLWIFGHVLELSQASFHKKKTSQSFNEKVWLFLSIYSSLKQTVFPLSSCHSFPSYFLSSGIHHMLRIFVFFQSHVFSKYIYNQSKQIQDNVIITIWQIREKISLEGQLYRYINCCTRTRIRALLTCFNITFWSLLF